jgi:hypothetical protein
MRLMKYIVVVWLMCILVIATTSVAQDEKRIQSVHVGKGRAFATFVQGRVTLVNKGGVLKAGDALSAGDHIKTGDGARLELKFPDGSYLRFDERSSFELLAADMDEKKQERKIQIAMILGKTWARVARFLKGRGRFEVQTKTSVCGVRGTSYRLNVAPNDSVMVKVYRGEIEVRRRLQQAASSGSEALETPVPVAGPHPVAGPQPVSMEAWTYILEALEQININPDGTAAPPFRFNLKEDLNDWVLWNQERDNLLDG